jgi:hypothetical protein
MEWVYFVLAAVALLVASATILPLPDLLKLQDSTVAIKNRPYITVADYSVTPSVKKVGESYDYRFTIITDLFMKEQGTDTKIVPVIVYEGKERLIKIQDKGQLLDTFTIKAGESGKGGQIFVADIVMNKAPLQKINPSDTATFKLNEPYYFDAENDKNFFFKIYMNQIETRGLNSCAVRFIAKCKEELEASRFLTACEHGQEDSTCSETLQPPPCGALITLTVRKINCGDLTASVEYSTDCRSCIPEKTIWTVDETAMLYFFQIREGRTMDPLDKDAACVYRFDKDRPSLCAQDELGNKELKFEPPQI